MNTRIDIVNEVGGPQSEFGVAAIRTAAGGLRLKPVTIAFDPNLPAEGFQIRRARNGYRVTGGDSRGAMYGALEIAEQISRSGSIRDTDRRPLLRVRGLKFNIPLPGTGYLALSESAQADWFWSLEYWRKFLDMAAENRYNTLTFWSAHPFDRLVNVAKYPESTDLSPVELDRNVAFFRELFQMAEDRGVDTYLMTWNIHVSRAFARNHDIPEAGFDSALVRDLLRQTILSLMATYSSLTGLGTTVGEEMPDMSGIDRLKWINETYCAALRDAGKTTPFILRTWGTRPAEVAEMLTARLYHGPIFLDIKYNGEHMYSSTEPHLGLDREWINQTPAGCQLLCHLRNDDVRILRWGDPDFVKDTLGGVSSLGSAGFIEGSEIDVPGPDTIHVGKAHGHVDWKYKFEKHWFRYMLWGRLGYWLAEPDDAWVTQFRHRLGASGSSTFEALREASKVLPLITSYHWNYMNGDWYPEGSIGGWNTSWDLSRPNYRRVGMYHDIFAYIFNSTIDQRLASIPEFLAGSTSTSPLDVAAQLKAIAVTAKEAMESARQCVGSSRSEFECTAADIDVWCELATYYSAKLQGACYLAKFLYFGDRESQKIAIEHLNDAVKAWRRIVQVTSQHYAPHEIYIFGLFAWKNYLPDVEKDVRIAQKAVPLRPESTYSALGLHPWLEYSYRLLGRDVHDSLSSASTVVRIQADMADSLSTPWILAEDPGATAGQCIVTEERGGEKVSLSFVEEVHANLALKLSGAASAVYRVELQRDGDYALWVRWQWGHSKSFLGVVIDESSLPLEAGSLQEGLYPQANAQPGGWFVQRLNARLEIGSGMHTVRFYSRAPGLKLDWFALAPASAETIDPAS